MTMHALLFQRPDDPSDHAVLLWAMQRDELLLAAITAHETRIGSRGEDQPVSERSGNGAVTRPSVPNHALNACSSGDIAVVVLPLLESCQPSRPHPDAAPNRCPAFVQRCGDRRERFDTRSMSNGSLANLPALELGDPPNCVLIELQQARHGSITKRRLGLDLLDRLGKALAPAPSASI
jgi:hypothetical protein